MEDLDGKKMHVSKARQHNVFVFLLLPNDFDLDFSGGSYNLNKEFCHRHSKCLSVFWEWNMLLMYKYIQL